MAWLRKTRYNYLGWLPPYSTYLTFKVVCAYIISANNLFGYKLGDLLEELAVA